MFKRNSKEAFNSLSIENGISISKATKKYLTIIDGRVKSWK